jgi:hypothetical protein
VPEIRVPFRPIIEEGEKPFAMLQDLWSKHRDWVFEPIYYSSVDTLIASLDEKIHPARRGEVCRTRIAEGRVDGRRACLGGPCSLTRGRSRSSD